MKTAFYASDVNGLHRSILCIVYSVWSWHLVFFFKALLVLWAAVCTLVTSVTMCASRVATCWENACRHPWRRMCWQSAKENNTAGLQKAVSFPLYFNEHLGYFQAVGRLDGMDESSTLLLSEPGSAHHRLPERWIIHCNYLIYCIVIMHSLCLGVLLSNYNHNSLLSFPWSFKTPVLPGILCLHWIYWLWWWIMGSYGALQTKPHVMGVNPNVARCHSNKLTS